MHFQCIQKTQDMLILHWNDQNLECCIVGLVGLGIVLFSVAFLRILFLGGYKVYRNILKSSHQAFASEAQSCISSPLNSYFNINK